MLKLACPSRLQIQEYLSGSLDDSQANSIASHLESCSDCEQATSWLEENCNWVETVCRNGTGETVESQGTDQIYEPLAGDQGSVEVKGPEIPQSMNSRLAEIGQRVFEHFTSPRQLDSINSHAMPMLTRLGIYELIGQLGHGGMGSVYLARHMELGKQVAIKTLPPVFARSAALVARFRSEIKAMGKLDHPSIVRATDAGVANNTQYLVMEAIDGLDASRIARLIGRLSIADACKICRDAAIGLSHAHAAGFVHRDIKPSNLMIDRQGQVKILDFGLALNLWDEGTAEVTTVGQMMGTLDYMAPEQAEKSEAVDYRADLYALGATLFRLLTGHPPLAASPKLSPIEKLRLLMHHTAPRIDTIREDLPEELVELIGQMLHRDPNCRPASAAHVAEQLSKFSSGSSLNTVVETALESELNQESCEENSLACRIQSVSSVPHPIETDSVLRIKETSQSDDITSAADSGPAITNSEDPGAFNTPRKSKYHIRWFIAAAAFTAAICGGIMFTLELTQGQLVIKSDVAEKIRVTLIGDSGQHAKEITIQPGTNTTRLQSGNYQIELDSASDSVSVDLDRFTISRGQLVVATVQLKSSDSSKPQQSTSTNSNTTFGDTIFRDKPLKDYVSQLSRERDSGKISEAVEALRSSVDLQGNPELAEIFARVAIEKRLYALLTEGEITQTYAILLGKGDHFEAIYDLVSKLPKEMQNYGRLIAYAQQPNQVTRIVEKLSGLKVSNAEIYTTVVSNMIADQAAVVQAGLQAWASFDEDDFLFRLYRSKNKAEWKDWYFKRACFILKQSGSDPKLVCRVLIDLRHDMSRVVQAVPESPMLESALQERFSILVNKPELNAPIIVDKYTCLPMQKSLEVVSAFGLDARFESTLKDLLVRFEITEADKTSLLQKPSEFSYYWNLSESAASKISSLENCDVFIKLWVAESINRFSGNSKAFKQMVSELYDQSVAQQLAARVAKPGDVLAIQIQGFLPAQGSPPFYQAGDRAPVQGFPILILDDGSINLPLLDPISAGGLTTAQIVEKIREELNKLNIPKASINVSYLMFAGEKVEVRNLTATPASTPSK